MGPPLIDCTAFLKRVIQLLPQYRMLCNTNMKRTGRDSKWRPAAIKIRLPERAVHCISTSAERHDVNASRIPMQLGVYLSTTRFAIIMMLLLSPGTLSHTGLYIYDRKKDEMNAYGILWLLTPHAAMPSSRVSAADETCFSPNGAKPKPVSTPTLVAA